MGYFWDSVGGGVRLAIALSRQAFIFWLVLMLPHSSAASIFQVLSLNSIFSFLLGGERYFSIISDRSGLAQVFGKTFCASIVMAPVYWLAVFVIFPELLSDFGALGVAAFYSAAVYDAMASNEQKVFTYLADGAFDDLKLNLLRNVLPIIVSALMWFVFDVQWPLSLFLGAGVLNVIYIGRWVGEGCPGIDFVIFDRSQLKLVMAGLGFRANVLFDRYASGILWGDAGVVAISLIQSVVSTVGGFVDTSFSKRVTGSGRFVLAVPGMDAAVKAALRRARVRSFLSRVNPLPALWFVVSFSACVAVLYYKSVPFDRTVLAYFFSYFLFSCYAHFLGVFSVCTIDPRINVYSPISRLIFVLPVLLVGAGAEIIFVLSAVISTLVSIYLVFSGFRLNPLTVVSPFKLFR